MMVKMIVVYMCAILFSLQNPSYSDIVNVRNYKYVKFVLMLPIHVYQYCP